ncbi:MAG: HAD family phosphatase [Chitinophagaceae bacterium]|nr:HAD family phosphatase [Chitinophagaceae bacterium]
MALPVKAFLFDLNGTMIDDMQYHNKAWFHILNDDLGANLSWEEVKEQMYGKNTELLIRIFGKDRFTKNEMDALSVEKEKRYQAEYRPLLKLIDGLDTFLAESKEAGVLMGIGSAAIPFNINFVLDGLNLRHYFTSIVSADDVIESKPDPETYLKGAAELGVFPQECIVFEDAPKGVEAAARAGMKAVVLTTMHEANEFSAYSNIISFIKDYRELNLSDLI